MFWFLEDVIALSLHLEQIFQLTAAFTFCFSIFAAVNDLFSTKHMKCTNWREIPLDNRSWDITARHEIYEEVYNSWRYPNLRLYYVNVAVKKKERLLAAFTL